MILRDNENYISPKGGGILSEEPFWEKAFDSGVIPKDEASFDAIVVGGGPSGSAVATYLAKEGRRVLLVEKGVWPRDKVCGDAVGGKALSYLAELGVKSRLEESPHFRVTSIIFGAPKGTLVDIPLPKEEVDAREAGYSLPRIQFDRLLFECATEYVIENGGNVVQGATVKSLLYEGGEGDARTFTGIELSHAGKKKRWHAPVIIGAGGYTCPVARAVVKETYGRDMVDREHYCGGWREYWSGVKGCKNDEGAIEIHFLNKSPGYFWMFPVGGGVVNVGVGVVLADLDKQKRKLKDLQANIIAKHPTLSQRFADAEMVKGSGKGWQLPFGSPREGESLQPRRAFANGVLLVGDAASLVDPFSGEGIGNALFSAKLAANSIIENEGVDIDSGMAYQQMLWDALGDELTNSHKLQKMSKRSFLLNWVLKKAAKKPKIQKLFTDMIASKDAQGKLHSKWYLIRTFLF